MAGRMVLSTPHTATPEGAVTRLADLGVPDYLVRDVLRGVLGQSLDIRPGQAKAAAGPAGHAVGAALWGSGGWIAGTE
ncbi:MAG: hypothetical protein JKP98_03835 [Rhodobacteraceae bacterium]|nr:hypothetical protein [Paracoccaceae bacterium]